MQTLKEIMDFDFSKPKEAIKAIEKQSYRKILFTTLTLVFSISLGVIFVVGTYNLGGKLLESKSQSLDRRFEMINTMPDADFKNMLSYIVKNQEIYNEKVGYIQSLVIKSELKNKDSYGTNQAEKLGYLLNDYKINNNDTINTLSRIRYQASNKEHISKNDLNVFIKYKSLYDNKAVLIDSKIEARMIDLLYSEYGARKVSSVEKDVYNKIKTIDNRINNTFKEQKNLK